MDNRITYYGKNAAPNPHNYHQASVRTMWGVKGIQEIGKEKTLAVALERLKTSDECQAENRKRLATLQRRVNEGEITLQHAIDTINTYPACYRI